MPEAPISVRLTVLAEENEETATGCGWANPYRWTPVDVVEPAPWSWLGGAVTTHG